MEKIKKALERAREKRSSELIDSSDQYHSHMRINPMEKVDLTKISYTKTKKIEVSKELLRKKRVFSGNENSNISSQYKVLRTHVLQCLKSNNWNSIAITSPNEGCGKTLTAINLAISMAREVNHSVLLVDMDLRRPSVQDYFVDERLPGISEYLQNEKDLNEILFNPGLDRMVVLPGNKSIENSSEMLSSPKMVDLVTELKKRYPNRIVIFDLPPLLSCDDVIAFSPYIDALMLVVSEGETLKKDLVRSYELLSTRNIIGTVLNKSNEECNNSSYY
ncbi:MAG: CpsD/CapB family tyrosine-protein kinase [Candidatus Thiodiazotropha lotti]|nr:CpsD/CapB family tyrosine-protein kinase [Candidatus Thiodiazotropha lotti]MCG7929574.1 CpsD/CapB family tyrosine-protein kinase [Candidatus Thiodiazotropha lotti]MCW4219416.1 CpsD/CapB family tyrosine-protein kinase [Candidatus Thiodiazotropha lotti]